MPNPVKHPLYRTSIWKQAGIHSQSSPRCRPSSRHPLGHKLFTFRPSFLSSFFLITPQLYRLPPPPPPIRHWTSSTVLSLDNSTPFPLSLILLSLRVWARFCDFQNLPWTMPVRFVQGSGIDNHPTPPRHTSHTLFFSRHNGTKYRGWSVTACASLRPQGRCPEIPSYPAGCVASS